MKSRRTRKPVVTDLDLQRPQPDIIAMIAAMAALDDEKAPNEAPMSEVSEAKGPLEVTNSCGNPEATQ
jgi:hypothetical protein